MESHTRTHNPNHAQLLLAYILLHPNRMTWQDNRNMTISEERCPIALPLLCVFVILWFVMTSDCHCGFEAEPVLVFLHLRIVDMVLSTFLYLTKNDSNFFHRKWMLVFQQFDVRGKC